MSYFTDYSQDEEAQTTFRFRRDNATAFETERRIVRRIGYFNNMMLDVQVGNEAVIPDEVDLNTFGLVLSYCTVQQEHHDQGSEITTMPEWEREFMRRKPQTVLFPLLRVRCLFPRLEEAIQVLRSANVSTLWLFAFISSEGCNDARRCAFA